VRFKAPHSTTPATASSASGHLFNMYYNSSTRKWRGQISLLGVPVRTGFYAHPWQAAAELEWQLARLCAHTGQPRSRYVSNAARLVALGHVDESGVLIEAVDVEPWDLSQWPAGGGAGDGEEGDAGGAVAARARPRRSARATAPAAAAAAAHVDDSAQVGAGGVGGGDGAEEWEGGGGVWDCVDDIDKAFMPLESIMGGGGAAAPPPAAPIAAAAVAGSGHDDGEHAHGTRMLMRTRMRRGTAACGMAWTRTWPRRRAAQVLVLVASASGLRLSLRASGL